MTSFILYHSGKANVVSNALSMKAESMESLAFIPVGEPLAMDVQALANRFVRLYISAPRRVLACVVVQSSLFVHIKARQYDDLYFLVLKDTMQLSSAKKVVIGDDSVIRLQGRICVPNFDGLRELILEEAHNSRYSIHYGARKMSSMSINIPVGLLLKIDIQEWKWERITMDFVEGLPRTFRMFDAIWVIVDRLTKSITLFEALYGRRYRSPVGWFEPCEDRLLGIDLFWDALAKVNLIKERLRTGQSRKKSYVDRKFCDVAFMEGEKVLLRVSPMDGVVRFGNKGKLSSRFNGPFEVF
ncbi:uncharacterized protein [Nicotiana tomentosiformis]|uniref:uncharacterized protein n=1 Tax=Nicotiana tomentosiformis TaxID=4098 RepID=UPI00388C361D